MFAHVIGRRMVAFALGVALLAAGCGQDRDGGGTPPTAIETETEPGDVRLPAELADPETPPAPEALLPELEDYVTDDTPDPGEIEASLEHGTVPYVDVRRRLILDEQAFAVGEVTVVTVEPSSAGGEAYLDHRYGDAPRRPVETAGIDMLRVETEPYDALAWTEPTFAVTFERGQERSDEWLEEFARATVQAIAAR